MEGRKREASCASLQRDGGGACFLPPLDWDCARTTTGSDWSERIIILRYGKETREHTNKSGTPCYVLIIAVPQKVMPHHQEEDPAPSPPCNTTNIPTFLEKKARMRGRR